MSTAVESDALVLFGGTGDLARKKLYPALIAMAKRGTLGVPVIVVALRDLHGESLRTFVRESLSQQGPLDEAAFAKVAGLLRYVGGDYGNPDTFTALRRALGGCTRPLYYLAIPPDAFPGVIGQLSGGCPVAQARVVVEKPFGRDLASARELNRTLHRAFAEDRIFRMDHYLGKEAIQNLFYFRFANSFLEPIWNRNYVASVQVTMAERFGIEGRGQFYDSVGALRDVVQNHLMQVLSLVAMEPPVGSGADELRNKKADVFCSMPDANPARYVRGQYQGYLDVDGVAKKSTTETYAALKLEVDNWRWAGVPFFIRAGKAMATKVTEVRLAFRRPPRLGFLGGLYHGEPNQVVLRVDPNPGLRIGLTSKGSGQRAWQPVHLDMLFAQELGPSLDPYERLLSDAMAGDDHLFTREDAVEETWRVMQPLLDDPPPVHVYEQGSWGPKEANELVRGVCDWHKPWLPGDPNSGQRADKGGH